MKVRLGRALIKSKFACKPRTNKSSVVEHSNLALLQMEKGNKYAGGTASRDMGQAKSTEPVHMVSSKMKMYKNEGGVPVNKGECATILLNFSRCIPPRIPFNMATGPLYKIYEQKIFSHWQSRQKSFPYERNLETWRQLWLTCERSDVIAQVLDARNLGFFFVGDLVDMYPEKKHVLLINKSDLALRGIKLPEHTENMVEESRGGGLPCYRDSSSARATVSTSDAGLLEKYEHVFYSSTDASHSLAVFLERFKGASMAFVGYPNVGKSSTMNAILSVKRVQTSQTPGKTKHLQTIVTSDMLLIDCPGIVFPKHDKFDLMINGVLNVDKVVDYSQFFQRLVAHVGEDVLRKKYAIKSKVDVESIWNSGGLDCGQLFKKIVKDYVAGNIQFA